jgi:predicted membrane GTPase involved in stress response
VGVNDLLDAVVKRIPHPAVSQDGELKMLINQTESNKYFGKMLIGMIQ